jgi:hypothetical protein
MSLRLVGSVTIPSLMDGTESPEFRSLPLVMVTTQTFQISAPTEALLGFAFLGVESLRRRILPVKGFVCEHDERSDTYLGRASPWCQTESLSGRLGSV